MKLARWSVAIWGLAVALMQNGAGAAPFGRVFSVKQADSVVAPSCDLFSRLFPPSAVVVPFSVDRNGSAATMVLHVRRDAPYSFDLDLGFQGEVARARLQPLVGDGRRSPSGVRLNDGIPIPIALKITRINGSAKTNILDREFSSHELTGFTSSSFIKAITVVSLRTGDYEVRVSSLRDVPEFHGIPINFEVHVALRK